MRIKKACKLVEEFGLDGLWIDAPSDLFYLTGLWFSLGRLLLSPQGPVLFVDGRYFDQAKQKAPCECVLMEKGAISSAIQKMDRIGFDSSFLTVDRAKSMQNLSIGKDWVPISKPIKELRVCKDLNELSALKKAAKLTFDGYQKIADQLEEGQEESELAFDFEVYCRKKGASKLSFDPIVAFGTNSAFAHYRAAKSRLEKGQIALFDLGAVVDDYRGDMTRCRFFGQVHPELHRFHELVKQAHDLAVEKIRPGVRIEELDVTVRSFFSQEKVEHLFTHSLGHGIGIDVHEYPLIRTEGEDRDLILRPGMVFTIEPGLYLPGLGGVRYENTFLVTETGSENFYGDD